MSEMRVKDLIAILQTVDPELPVHKRGTAGDFPPVDSDYIGHWLNYDTLMRSKNDPTYYARNNDVVWRKHRSEFEKKFKAVVIW
jgi:hypothetical protein